MKQLSEAIIIKLIIANALVALFFGISNEANAASVSPVFAAIALEISPKENNDPAPARYSYVSNPLYPKTEFQGKVTSFKNSLIIDEQSEMEFGILAPDPQLGHYHLRLTSGEQKGRCLRIIVNDSQGSLYLEEDPSEWIQIGDTFVIERNPSFNSLFGSDNSHSDLNHGNNFISADVVSTMDNLGKLTSYYPLSSQNDSHTWVDMNSEGAGNSQINPNQGLIIHRRSSSPGNIVLCGIVPETRKTYLINPGINYFGSGCFSESVSLDQLNLQELSSGLNLFEADSVTIPSSDGTQQTFFYLQSDTTSMWVSENYQNADSVLIKPGQAFYINRLLDLPSIRWTPISSE